MTITTVQPYVETAPHPIDMQLARELSRVLTAHYPGYMWAVNVDHTQGIATIECWDASQRHGYVLHMGALGSANDVKNAAIKAGGEILERHGLRRAAASEDQVRDARRKALFV